MSDHSSAQLSDHLRDLFPEVCGAPIDLEAHAPAVVIRALNDAAPRVQQKVIDHYGLERVARITRSRADRLTNPAYRAWREPLGLPPRPPDVEFVQGLWRK